MNDHSSYKKYRVVQLSFTPEIEVFYMLFKRSLSIYSMTSLKQHMEYFNFRCQIQLDHHVLQKNRVKPPRSILSPPFSFSPFHPCTTWRRWLAGESWRSRTISRFASRPSRAARRRRGGSPRALQEWDCTVWEHWNLGQGLHFEDSWEQ